MVNNTDGYRNSEDFVDYRWRSSGGSRRRINGERNEKGDKGG